MWHFHRTSFTWRIQITLWNLLRPSFVWTSANSCMSLSRPSFVWTKLKFISESLLDRDIFGPCLDFYVTFTSIKIYLEQVQIFHELQSRLSFIWAELRFLIGIYLDRIQNRKWHLPRPNFIVTECKFLVKLFTNEFYLDRAEITKVILSRSSHIWTEYLSR